MTKYIELEAAYKFIFDIPNPNGAGEIEVISVDDLDTIPTIDFTPVRHGQWNEYDDDYGNLSCSVCENDAPNDIPWDYCPHCGARMDGE